MIVIIHPFLDNYGGAERKVLLLLQSLIKRNEDAIIITKSYDPLFSDYLETNKNLAARIIVLNASTLWSWILKAAIFASKVSNLRVIFASNYPANLVAVLAKLFSTCNPSVVWMCNEVSSAVNSRNLIKSKFFSSIEKYCLRNIDKIYCNSASTSQSLMSRYQIKCQGIIYSGIDTTSFDKYFDPEFVNFPTNRDIEYLYLGRVEKHKNVDLLMELASVQPNSKITIAGTGQFLKEFRDNCKLFPNMEFKGCISNEEKIRMLIRTKVLLFPSKNEPLGVVVMEAIYCGCWVIAFNRGGPREIMLKTSSGTLVSGQVDFLEAAVSSCLLSMNRSQIIENRIRIRRHFSSSRMGLDMINAIYNA